MWWTAQTSQKYLLPYLPNAVSPPDKYAVYGMASYRKSLLTSHSVKEMCFSCFINTKYKYLMLIAYLQ